MLELMFYGRPSAPAKNTYIRLGQLDHALNYMYRIALTEVLVVSVHVQVEGRYQ